MRAGVQLRRSEDQCVCDGEFRAASTSPGEKRNRLACGKTSRCILYRASRPERTFQYKGASHEKITCRGFGGHLCAGHRAGQLCPTGGPQRAQHDRMPEEGHGSQYVHGHRCRRHRTEVTGTAVPKAEAETDKNVPKADHYMKLTGVKMLSPTCP